MIPNFNDLPKDPKEKLKNNFFISFFGVLLIISALFFTGYGTVKLFIALFTSYQATTLDLLYFATGSMLLFFITITNMLMDIKAQNTTLGKGILHLVRMNSQAPQKGHSSFEDALKGLFSNQPGVSGDDVSGSISLYDMSNPDNPLFQGSFKNMDEMNDLKKNLLDKMLSSQKEFKGKKMTNQEILDTMNMKELKAELTSAVDAEDWLWAASLRDKIKEKETARNKGNSESDKKDNPEM